MESAKLYYTESMLDGGLTSDKTFVFNDDMPEGLNYSGSSPKGGSLTLTADGKITLAIHNGNYCAIKSATDRNISIINYEEGKCAIAGSEKNPVVTLNGDEHIELYVGDTYTELGATAKTVDGSPLEYNITIYACFECSAGNLQTKQIPEEGEATEEEGSAEESEEEGPVEEDDCVYSMVDTVDTSRCGTYEITYTAEINEMTVTAVRTVTVLTK